MRSKFKWIFTLVLALSMQFSFAQEKTVTGTVTDGKLPLPGANVVIKGTAKGVSADMDGKYSIKAKSGDVLVISFSGFDNKTITVGSANSYNVALKENTKVLDDVVIKVGMFKKDINKIAVAASIVSSEELVRQSPVINVANALQGKAAGVQVTAQNGKPGATAFISIRGNVSISGSSSGAVYVVDGARVASSEIASINPSDVENVVVLKDGASAAMYGAFGGNGVIVITTKRAKNSKGKFEYSNSFGYSEKTKDPFQIMNASQKINYENLIEGGPSFGLSDAEIGMLKSFDHDWRNDLLKKGFQQTNSFSYSGGGENFSNRLSVGYSKDDGIIKNMNGYDRISARYNSEVQANKSIKLNFNLGGSYEKYQQPRDRNNAQNPFRAMYDYNPYEPLYQRDPVTGAIIYNSNGSPEYNVPVAGYPVAEAIVNCPEQERFFRIYGRPSIDFNLYKGLVASSKINLNYERRQREAFTKPGSFLDQIVGDPNAKGSKTDAGWDSFEYTWTNQLTYKFKIGENNNFDATLLHEYYKNNYRGYTLTRKGFVNGDLDTSGTAVVGVPSTTRNEDAYVAYFAGVEYDYAGKYLVSASYRRDGNSMLGVNNKWSPAVGGSIGWVVSKDLFPNNKYVNNLKLRASYGELNATNLVSAYSAQTTFSTSNYAGNAGTVVSGSTVGNPDLKFEKVRKLDFGFESSLFNNRLILSSSYFKDKRSDFIYGYSSLNGPGWGYSINAGDWTAKGLELELRGTVLRTANSSLILYVNAAKFDRKVNKLVTGNESEQLLRGLTINKPGHIPDEYYLVEYAGVDPTNGHALYRNEDGSVTDVYDSNNQKFTGKSPYAKYEGGFGVEFKYYGFDIAADFNFKQGNYTYNYMWMNLNADGTSVDANQATDAFDFWTPNNTQASQPAPFNITGIDSNQISDRFLQDASYIRFRSLNLGYTFSKKLLNNLPIDQVRIFTQFQNLYTWTKYKGDPEVGIGSGETQTSGAIPGQYALYSYPTVKSFTFGLSINF